MESEREGEIKGEVLDAITAAVKSAVSDAITEQKRQERTKILYNTRKLMEAYREMKKYIENAISEEEEVTEATYLIFAGENSHLQSVRRSKMATAMMIANIDRALKELEAENEEKGTSYKYKAFKMHYIDGIAFEEIAYKLNSGKNSPSTWCKVILKQMSVKLFGINGIEHF